MPNVSRYLYIAALIIAGEIIFGLPFHTARFFRPTMLEVFGFTNTQLGDLFALYGLTAMLSYFPGGAIADLPDPSVGVPQSRSSSSSRSGSRDTSTNGWRSGRPSVPTRPG